VTLAMESLAKESTEAAPNWEYALRPEIQDAIGAAARIVSTKYKDRAVNMLAERDDLVQEGLILVATKTHLQDIEPALLTFRLVQHLNGQVKYGATRATATTYLSALEKE